MTGSTNLLGGVSSQALTLATAMPRIPSGLYLIHPGRTDALVMAFDGQMRALAGAADASREANTNMRGEKTEVPFGYRIDNGSAIIPVMGTLVSRGAFAGTMWGVTSYEGLRSEIRRAAADNRVTKIVLAVDSPGGMVSGIETVAEEINAAKKSKPVAAHIEGMAASAAYWIASQADQIVMTPLSEVGSIGVVSMHTDVSGALAGMGVKMTTIFSGAHKVDGNPYEPLPDSVRADMQADVDRLRVEFARAVATGRPGLATNGALATEARMYSSEDAIRLGLADSIGSLDNIVTISANITRRSMAEKMEIIPMVQEHTTTISNPTASVAASDPTGADTKARIKAIFALPEAEGRRAQTEKLAFETELSVEAIASILGCGAKEAIAPIAPTIPSVAERSASLASLGALGASGAPAPDAKKSLESSISAAWDKAISRRAALVARAAGR